MSWAKDTITSNNVIDIKAKTDNLPTDPADQSLLEDDHTTILGHTAVIQGNQAIPGVDDVANAFVRDVVGNKTDTVGGNSLIALAKIISLTKLGDTSDSHGITTIFARLKTIIEHIHGTSLCIPSLDAPITLTTGTPAWTLGTKVEIAGAGAIASDFDFHWATISALTANANYELHIWKGGVGVEVFAGCFPFQKSNNFTQEGSIGVLTELFPANTRISVSIASDSGNADTCDVKLQYHLY